VNFLFVKVTLYALENANKKEEKKKKCPEKVNKTQAPMFKPLFLFHIFNWLEYMLFYFISHLFGQ